MKLFTEFHNDLSDLCDHRHCWKACWCFPQKLSAGERKTLSWESPVTPLTVWHVYRFAAVSVITVPLCYMTQSISFQRKQSGAWVIHENAMTNAEEKAINGVMKCMASWFCLGSFLSISDQLWHGWYFLFDQIFFLPLLSLQGLCNLSSTEKDFYFVIGNLCRFDQRGAQTLDVCYQFQLQWIYSMPLCADAFIWWYYLSSNLSRFFFWKINDGILRNNKQLEIGLMAAYWLIHI